MIILSHNASPTHHSKYHAAANDRSGLARSGIFRLVALTVFTISISLLAGCMEEPAADASQGGMPPPPPVATAAALSQQWAPQLHLTGRLESSQQVDVRPQTSGRIIEVLVRDGAHVKAGDVLFRLEDAPLKARLAQAQAALARAEAQLLIAQQRDSRNRPLVDDDILGAQILDESEADMATATADITAAKATIQAVEVDLAYTTITAPIDGRVGRVLTTLGNVVQGGSGALGTHLLTLVYDQTIDVAFDLPEHHYLQHASRLQAAVNDNAELPVNVMLDGHDTPLQGTLFMIDNQTNAGSGVVRLYARIDNPQGQFIPGVFARIQLQLEEPRDVLLINERAVMAQLNSRYVYTVGEGGVTMFTPVKLGERMGDLRVVESGLTGEEQIAVTNLKKIFFPGMPVQPVPGDMTTASALTTPAQTATPAEPAKVEGH